MSVGTSLMIWVKIHNYCETTSVRGAPRIVRSTSKQMSFFCILVVSLCACILLYHLVSVFSMYKSYPLNTLFVQSPDGQNPTFPDVTVCNIMSFGSSERNELELYELRIYSEEKSNVY